MYFRLEVKTDRGWEGLWAGLWYNRNGYDEDPDTDWSDRVWIDPVRVWADDKLPRADLGLDSKATCWFTKDGWFEIGVRLEELLQQYAPKDKFRIRTLDEADNLRQEYRDFWQVAIRERNRPVIKDAVFA